MRFASLTLSIKEAKKAQPYRLRLLRYCLANQGGINVREYPLYTQEFDRLYSVK